MKVRVDRELCIGAGNCVAIAPKVFELDQENKAIVLEVSSTDEKTIWDAAQSCPTQAVIIEDDDGNQQFP